MLCGTKKNYRITSEAQSDELKRNEKLYELVSNEPEILSKTRDDSR